MIVYTIMVVIILVVVVESNSNNKLRLRLILKLIDEQSRRRMGEEGGCGIIIIMS